MSKKCIGKDVGFEGLDLVQIAVKIGSLLTIHGILDNAYFTFLGSYLIEIVRDNAGKSSWHIKQLWTKQRL